MQEFRFTNLARAIVGGLVLTAMADVAISQNPSRPIRAKPPQFGQADFEGCFFQNVESALVGDFPTFDSGNGPNGDGKEATVGSSQTASVPMDSSSLSQTTGSQTLGAWKSLISAGSIEDLIKESKLRLDKTVTTPSAFASGGFQEARKEFSLLSLLFAIIENYPEEVRWKSSASSARLAMNRVAANTKIGSRQVFDEAKKRLQDLDALMNGVSFPSEPSAEVVWENLIDLVPLMQVLANAYEQHVQQYSANDIQFAKHRDELRRNAELIAVLMATASMENMPNASDEQFVQIADELTRHARQLVDAVDKGDPLAARLASGNIGQKCQECHASFR